MSQNLLTVPQLAERLGEHPQTVRKHTRAGAYASFAINLGTATQPRWRYHPGRLEKWLAGRASSAA